MDITKGFPPLGTRLEYSLTGKFQEWRQGGPYYFAGIGMLGWLGTKVKPNVNIADKWPIESPGNVTDGFDPEEWDIVTFRPTDEQIAELIKDTPYSAEGLEPLWPLVANLEDARNTIRLAAKAKMHPAELAAARNSMRGL